MCYIEQKYYLLQKRYDRVTILFFDGKMSILDYQIFINYFENEATKKLFTINLN